ncbi:LuxR C-terminal-related transcriptional regulator [Ectobacillus panaciterrae]|uniref:LuxR C-terminal-related transcriptional regulator n=1 Tax=Ectobacillus panaciterrae TaxID=363872 RepID=UPI00040F77E9
MDPRLTKREREVFELLVQDKTTKEIAGELFISEKTVRNHISNEIQMQTKLDKLINSDRWLLNIIKETYDRYIEDVVIDTLE